MMGAAMNMGMTTPPLSAGTSFDSKHDSAIGGDETPFAATTGGRVVFDEEYFKANVNRVVTDEWNEMVMECEVTGMPTRDHWKVSFLIFLFLVLWSFLFFSFVCIWVGKDGNEDGMVWQLPRGRLSSEQRYHLKIPTTSNNDIQTRISGRHRTELEHICDCTQDLAPNNYSATTNPIYSHPTHVTIFAKMSQENHVLSFTTNIPLSQPDSSSPTCDDPSCTLPSFTFLTRRHHCRRCGHIFCSKHLAYLTPLDHQARFHPKGVEVPTCRCCWQDFGAWSLARKHRASAGSEGSGSGSGVSTPTMGGGVNVRGGAGGGERKESVMVVGSVRGDSNWSTF